MTKTFDVRLDSFRSLNPKIQNLTWVNALEFGGFDCSVDLEVSGKSYRGRGWAQDENLAFVKAVAEASERAALGKSPFTSSWGMAAHTDKVLAIENAKRELFERDAFLCHYLSRTPFLADNSEKPKWFLQLRERLAHKNAELVSFLLKSDFGVETSLVCVFGENYNKRFGGTLGLSCGLHYNDRLRSATCEALRNFTAQEKSPTPSISLSDFLRLETVTPEHRQRLFLDLGFFREIEFIFLESINELNDSPVLHTLDDQRWEIQELPDPTGIGFAIVRAFHPDLQGELKSLSNGLNTKRLSQFMSVTPTIESLNPHPHILG